ncbi:hypothetical protein ACP70R_003586 [Stipagrostis hirtigluma subsp. patula]
MRGGDAGGGEGPPRRELRAPSSAREPGARTTKLYTAKVLRLRTSVARRSVRGGR